MPRINVMDAVLARLMASLRACSDGGLDRSALLRGVPRPSRRKLDRDQETS